MLMSNIDLNAAMKGVFVSAIVLDTSIAICFGDERAIQLRVEQEFSVTRKEGNWIEGHFYLKSSKDGGGVAIAGIDALACLVHLPIDQLGRRTHA
jgi:hypothetical protein